MTSRTGPSVLTVSDTLSCYLESTASWAAEGMPVDGMEHLDVLWDALSPDDKEQVRARKSQEEK